MSTETLNDLNFPATDTREVNSRMCPHHQLGCIMVVRFPRQCRGANADHGKNSQEGFDGSVFLVAVRFGE
ncbi:hypothetical protein E2C01_077019 [Portunus trituberculatus]|uniref:Uncharacterized protein n=1 Tax=Portunus trituberculatus TaxID=210409 RepID=A0A5B7ING1_PORTR|nr:hypothetical protein [Portunus trituberculatus]